MPLFLQTSRSFVEHMNVYEAGALTRKEISFDATVPQFCVASSLHLAFGANASCVGKMSTFLVKGKAF